MAERIAPEGQVWVCLACGKTSRDRYGDRDIINGWDESCMLNSRLCYEDKVVKQGGRVREVLADGFAGDDGFI